MSERKGGRPKKLNVEIYLEAVRKLHSVNDYELARHLKVSQPTVYRFRTNEKNVDESGKWVWDLAQEIISEYSELDYTKDLSNWDIFKQIPIIVEWEKILDVNVSEVKKNTYMHSFWYVIKELQVHPKKVTPEECAELCVRMKELYYAGIDAPRGLAYTRIRSGIRSFFTLIHKISSEYLSLLGVTAENTLGSGMYSKQRVNESIRHKWEKVLKEHCLNANHYLEVLYIGKFQFYTGTRISAVLEFSFENDDYLLEKDKWMFEITDKGEHKKGRLKWSKYLVDFALEDFKDYCSKRFKIDRDKLEVELPLKVKHLFPTFVDEDGSAKDDKVRDINKPSLKEAGLPYKDFQPTHIWRHTFAQTFLEATNWNYELCGSLGGWINTLILKKHYGEMSEDVKVRGLMKSMGVKMEEEEVKELRW